jgi:MoaA/NifB/PqqE/SkfB family radical SAM enzyme
MIKQGFMDFDLYKKMVDECARHGVYSIRLSWRGEPLMHPKIVDMIRYAKDKGIKESMILTNGSLLTHEMSENIIKAGLGSVSISIDGIGKKFEEIRQPAKFDEQVERITYLFNMRKKLKSMTPKIKINCLWSAVEKDHEEFMRIFKPISDAIYFNKLVDWHPQEPLVEKYRCFVIWQRLFITWDGTIVCYGDHNEVAPIAKYDGTRLLADIWNGPEFSEFRKDNKNWKRLKHECCQKCYYGREKKRTKYEYN